jgi:hypothetical protein
LQVADDHLPDLGAHLTMVGGQVVYSTGVVDS